MSRCPHRRNAVWHCRKFEFCTADRRSDGVAVAEVGHPVTKSYIYTLSPVSTGMGDRLWTCMPARYVTKPARSTRHCIPPGSRNLVPASTGWCKGENVTSVGWQLILCDPGWHERSVVRLLYSLPYQFRRRRLGLFIKL